jgi:hypothetical protein
VAQERVVGSANFFHQSKSWITALHSHCQPPRKRRHRGIYCCWFLFSPMR